jgi:hypothetical protein
VQLPAAVGGKEDCRKDNPACCKTYEICMKNTQKVWIESMPIQAGGGVAGVSATL